MPNSNRPQVLHEIERLIILTSRSPAEIAAATFPYLREFVPYQRASIILFDLDADYATLLTTDSSSPADMRSGKHLPLHQLQGIATLKQGKPFVAQDPLAVAALSGMDSQWATEGIQAYVMLPLMPQGELIGSLNLGVVHKTLLAMADVTAAQAAADQVAVTIQQALLWEADKRHLLESEAIAAISQALTETLDLEEVFQLIAESAWQIIPRAERTVIHLLDEQAQVLQPIAVTRSGEVAHDGLMMRSGEGIAGHVVMDGTLINVPDTHTDPRFLASGSSRYRSLMVAPIKSREENIGTISVQSMAPHAFAENDERLLTVLGIQAALAIKNARLFAAEQRARHIAEILQAANMALTQTLELDVVLSTLLEYVSQLIPYDSANVMLIEENGQVALSALRGYEAWLMEITPLQEMSFVVEQPILSEIVKTQRSFIIADTRANADWNTAVGASHVRSWLAVPLLAGGEVIGLYSMDKAEPHFFTEEHRELAEAFSGQAAMAIYNALLYKAEREQFQRLQQSQMQLVQAEKMGAMGRLVASIAHEINNPIQAMQGCLALAVEELAEVEPDAETVDMYLGIVKSEMNRVSTIVSNMREFYRPATAVMELTDIHKVIKSVLKLTAKQLERSHITLVQNWDEDVPFIEANASHLRQVFLNLVLNAIDSMGQGGVLQLSTTLAEMESVPGEGRSAVRIQISDTGCGMSAEVASRLFEPFFTTKEQGSGLGLSISYGIIEAHHGEISVQSQIGVGTTFTLLLPLKQM